MLLYALTWVDVGFNMKVSVWLPQLGPGLGDFHTAQTYIKKARVHVP